MGKILIIGACGQLGTELTEALVAKWGQDEVIATDIREPQHRVEGSIFERLDILNVQALHDLITKHEVSQVYQLAALLSASAEKNPAFAWKLNMEGLFNVLEAARIFSLEKIYWPSSIAVFGPGTPKKQTAQNPFMDPNTVYGISKLAGERWCEYYHAKYGVDVRSLRYPGLIGYKGLPGGGTTDYAVDIFHQAIQGNNFSCFLKKDTYLPMMFMPDAIKATLDLMEAPAESIKVRSSYNVAALSFSPEELFQEIKKHFPDFSIDYHPDYRQAIADSWPDDIDDSVARQDWGWKPDYDLKSMCQVMLEQLSAIAGRATNS